MFRDELFSGEGDVVIWLNSPGGDYIAASQIYSMLMDYKGNVTVKVDGLAASAASVIAMAGTKVVMAPTAMMMIHNPSTAAFGDHKDMQKVIEMLDEVKESIINAYEIKTGLSHPIPVIPPCVSVFREIINTKRVQITGVLGVVVFSGIRRFVVELTVAPLFEISDLGSCGSQQAFNRSHFATSCAVTFCRNASYSACAVSAARRAASTLPLL